MITVVSSVESSRIWISNNPSGQRNAVTRSNKASTTRGSLKSGHWTHTFGVGPGHAACAGAPRRTARMYSHNIFTLCRPKMHMPAKVKR